MISIIKNGEIQPIPKKRIVDLGISNELKEMHSKLIDLCIDFKTRDKSDIPSDIYELLKTFDRALILTNARLKQVNQDLLVESLTSGSRSSYFNQEERKKNMINGSRGGGKSATVKKGDDEFLPICNILMECIKNEDYINTYAIESINLLLAIPSILNYIQLEKDKDCSFCALVEKSYQNNLPDVNLHKILADMTKYKSKNFARYDEITDIINSNSKSPSTIEKWKSFYKKENYKGFLASHLI
ncbi:MAG: hypothetical protein HRT52_22240 [Colwellia sp.]|nr:hypothetical protein [Colwellia sp.]